mgnify:CR=1 FL=1
MFSNQLEETENNDQSISLIDIQTIENTGLSSFDKHYIRLLAHCLGCFKEMAGESSIGSLPSPDIRSRWLRSHGNNLIDEYFLNVLLEQFVSAANQLDNIADHFDISPLELTLDYLIQFVKSSFLRISTVSIKV